MRLAKEPSRIEAVNDLDSDVVNFFWIIQRPKSREQQTEWLTYTPYARQVYGETFETYPQLPVEQIKNLGIVWGSVKDTREDGTYGRIRITEIGRL